AGILGHPGWIAPPCSITWGHDPSECRGKPSVVLSWAGAVPGPPSTGAYVSRASEIPSVGLLSGIQVDPNHGSVLMPGYPGQHKGGGEPEQQPHPWGQRGHRAPGPQ